ncbi:hypothetical protein [Mycobacterium sp. AZCC_0083]|uniref:hypothetical protein n=1 Tax=Mycobacterium sp. AZCC_0083 TaxID=2735882 RepID=UPI001607BD5D|nr:hypothetical protein [Mycobacterium sp. AZCC_0083]MBB5167124.1 hypothetical protein [Mycobacterium sp. AZCC_0083]
MSTVPTEIAASGPTYEQIVLAREVIARVSTGPKWIGNPEAVAVDEWLRDRQVHLQQQSLRQAVADTVWSLVGSVSGESAAKAVVQALSNYELKRV